MARSNQVVSPKGLRVLAPAGGFPSITEVFNAYRRRKQMAQESSSLEGLLGAQLQQSLALDGYLLTANGKHALELVFRFAKELSGRNSVLIAGYTCPDIISSCVQAGLQPVVLDIDPRTLDFDTSALSEAVLKRTAVVLLSNLFGLADELALWRDLQKEFGFLIVDDSCQAGLSISSGVSLGSREGTIGVLSFGRGKAFGALGGGAVFWSQQQLAFLSRHHQCWGALAEKLIAERKRLSHSPFRAGRDLIRGALYNLFERPSLYGLPARIPWLGLGRTEYQRNYFKGSMSQVSAAYALTQLMSLESRTRTYIIKAKRWQQVLAGFDVVQPFVERSSGEHAFTVPIRYPIICRTAEARDRLWLRLAESGLGVSRAYPLPLPEYPGVADMEIIGNLDSARSVSERILTLPVHEYVRGRDVEKVIDIFCQEVEEVNC